jgi:hypothetical protein
MTDDGLRETASPPGRGRAAAGLKYVPLTVLMLLVVTAVVLGVIESRSIDRRESASAAAPAGEAKAKATLPPVCAPPVDQGIDVEHWRDDDRESASEATFERELAGEKPGYVTGRGGWLFFNDIQIKDLSQAVGRERQGRRQVARWNTYLTGLKRAAEAKGGRFYILIGPAKWDVYPDRLPRWAADLRGTNSLDHLQAEHPELPFIDVRAPLRSAGAKVPTYSPLNSHWTDYGGYVAWQAVTACLRADGAAGPELDVPAIRGVERVADVNEFATDGVELPAEPQATRPRYRSPHPVTTVVARKTGDTIEPRGDDVVDTSELPVETRTTGAQTDETLLVLRDSFGNALSPLWSTSFARTVQYQHPVGEMGAPVDLPAVVDDVRPDITIFTMTERYLWFDPPTS